MGNKKIVFGEGKVAIDLSVGKSETGKDVVEVKFSENLSDAWFGAQLYKGHLKKGDILGDLYFSTSDNDLDNLMDIISCIRYGNQTFNFDKEDYNLKIILPIEAKNSRDVVLCQFEMVLMTLLQLKYKEVTLHE